LLVSKYTITKDLLVKQDTMLIISDMSIKNNIAILISHIHRDQEIITKSIHYTTNINSTKAELFTIRYEINHATHLQDITHILLSSQMLSQLPNGSLICQFIHINYTLLLY